jgi:Zn-dependent protease with chaperone function
MARGVTLYPPSPTRIPEGLTAPGSDYKLRVWLVLTGLVLFFLLYLGLVAGTGFLTVWFLFQRPIAWGVVLSLCTGLFFLFLVKRLFRRERLEKAARIEIFEDEQPRLFAFVRRLCDEIDAPFPKRIFVSYEVNAAVFYDESLASLFRPSPKNLLIGLGLVNLVNLSEFKAILAHEFGHFRQSSMKLGTYVYQVNRLIGDIVFARGRLDAWAREMCHRDDGAALVIGWSIYLALTGFRLVIEGFFFAINFLNMSLSRQMEFNADLVAVSVSGSDPIINGLVRAGFGDLALMQAFSELTVAADHKLYSWDLFVHQAGAAAYLRRLHKDPHLGERPPALPADATVMVQVFSRDDDGGPPSMWSAHPSNYERERNAKRDYIGCPADDRSPWLLFDKPHELRERVTWNFYRVVVKLNRDVSLADPAAVEAFIKEEHAETTYDPRYQGFYDNRFIKPGEIGDLVRTIKSEPLSPPEVAGLYAGLYAGTFSSRMEEYALLREELGTLTGLRDGRLKLQGEEFTFRTRRYGLADVNKLLKRVRRDMDEELEWAARLDRRVFCCHYRMAMDLGSETVSELLNRYRFHLDAQELAVELAEHQEKMDAALAFLRGRSRVHVDDFIEVRDVFRDAHDALDRCLGRADRLALPELKNMTGGEPVGHFLLEKSLVPQFGRSARALSGKKIGRFLGQFAEVQDKLRRIHYKSLGAILKLQEAVAEKWRALRRAAEPAVMDAIMVAESVDAPATPTGSSGNVPLAAGEPADAIPLATVVAVADAAAGLPIPAQPLNVEPVSVSCGCRSRHELPESLRGRRVRCKSCQELMVVRAPRRRGVGDGETLAAAKSRDRRDEIVERPCQDGPSITELVSALTAAGVFLLLVSVLTLTWLMGGPRQGAGAQAAAFPGQPANNLPAGQANHGPAVAARPTPLPARSKNPGLPPGGLFSHRPYRFLADLEAFDVRSGPWPVTKGDCGNGQPIQFGGARSRHGLGMHPPAAPAYTSAKFCLGKQAELFKATAAINDTTRWCWSPAVFTVHGDGKELWRSVWIAHNHTHSQKCRVSVAGVDVLQLRVECVNNNPGVHAVWLEPRVLQKSDSPDAAED